MSSDRDDNRAGGAAPVEEPAEGDATGEYRFDVAPPAWYMQSGNDGAGATAPEGPAEASPAETSATPEIPSAPERARLLAAGRTGTAAGTTTATDLLVGHTRTGDDLDCWRASGSPGT